MIPWVSHVTSACVNTSVTCMWPPHERQVCFKCMRQHDKCLIDGKSMMQHVLQGSRPSKWKKTQIVLLLTVEELNEPRDEHGRWRCDSRSCNN